MMKYSMGGTLMAVLSITGYFLLHAASDEMKVIYMMKCLVYILLLHGVIYNQPCYCLVLASSQS